MKIKIYNRRKIVIVLFLIAIAYTLVQCNTEIVYNKEPVYLNLNDTVKYVGMETCKQCHADVSEPRWYCTRCRSFDSFGLGARQSAVEAAAASS